MLASERKSRQTFLQLPASACLLFLLFALMFPLHNACAATGGSLTGTITDPTGVVLPGGTVTLESASLHSIYRATADEHGFYSFPNLPVGHYDLTATSGGFAPLRRPGIAVDADAALQLDLKLSLDQRADEVTVTANETSQIDLTSTHLGQVINSREMTSLPLNGRSYTDLLALQPGVAPISTLLPSSVIMAGVTGSLDPSGDLNPGNLSINGQRESSNGFLVNGIDVQEHMNGGTSVVPNLDSIDEFRVLTNSFDPEYGNYNGGMITVISRSGNNSLHGSAFEFFRNTALDARGYFDPTRSAFKQNQFGGTLGGPILRNRLFVFGDYQGTRTTQGISTGSITVPTLAQRAGSFDDLSGSVSGPYLASLLTSKLGRTVTSGEAYSSVFPSGTIPAAAWSTPGQKLFQYIPKPNISSNQFSTSDYAQTVRDDKGSLRADANTHFGQISGYYFADDYRLDNPYPGAVGGASIPGFDALFLGRAQVFALGATTVLGANTVNELHLGFLRNANVIGQPKGGTGVSLASQGFTTGANTSGIVVQAPQFEGVENLDLPGFTMGVPISNETQVNNTIYLSDGLSRAFGPHTVKVGVQAHFDQVNEHPNGIFNGTFNLNGTETGDAFADLLLGVPSSYQQSSGPQFYLRNRYFGSYAQDSWHARQNLTLNAGLRWDVIMPFWEKYNQLGTFLPGNQSTLFPGAPAGVVVVGDPGVPSTIAPTHYTDFSPRIGFAYAPAFDRGLAHLLFGVTGQSSIRASFGVFHTQFPGLLAGIMYAVPPYGYTYISPGPPLLGTPFVTAATGVDNGQRFPFAFPSHNVSRSNPDSSIDWSNFLPFESDPFFNVKNRSPYLSNYMLSFQRQINPATLLTVSYVGNQGHRVPTVVSVNPGNAALCLSLSQCGPFGEDNNYTSASGATVYGTRSGQNDGLPVDGSEQFGENTSVGTIANSSYNALESTLRYQHGASHLLLSYAWAKSIDQGSNIGEQLNPFDARLSRAISAWDQKHTFVASYSLALPVQNLFRASNRWTQGWTVSGTTRFATGFPVTLTDTSDNSLLGTLGNGVNNYLLDTPRYLAGEALHINHNGRNNQPAFNTAVFPEEVLGQLGNSRRRMFYGPGIENFDLSLQKSLRLGEGHALDLRAEGFNVFNHAQFYGPASVDGQVEDPNFGRIISAAAPRLIQLVAKFSF
ncbi:TonB-dependent Receptor Plug Domain [Bryocella elongata]|uniref:TonB-dependent Receptor Plug Domain n=1 Tax=Bryocella elongata TaxID=863522 RepID=A0A1H5TWT5_9BACT|nr:carboxypeptidase-like regulatory domain-containing protein [Bryocella elongata]SEF67322.1 TonB-dependent Receptor Plug Domain [Bryocella elongata]